jgi:hypothetical protein
MRRVTLALLFPLLLAAQQGSFVHSLEHFAVATAPAGASAPQQAPADSSCEKCFTYSAVGSAVSVVAALLAVAAGTTESIALLPAAVRVADVRSPRSRGPPSLP